MADEFNMDGLLSFAKTPEAQGLLGGLFAGLAGARRGAPLNTLGIAGLGGMHAYTAASDPKRQIDGLIATRFQQNGTPQTQGIPQTPQAASTQSQPAAWYGDNSQPELQPNPQIAPKQAQRSMGIASDPRLMEMLAYRNPAAANALLKQHEANLNGFKQDVNAYYTGIDGVKRYNADPTKGYDVQNGVVSPMAGFLATNNAIEGGKANATEQAKARWNVPKASDVPMLNGRPFAGTQEQLATMLQNGNQPQQPQGMQQQGGQVTDALLDSLRRVESSGNPNAVNPKSGAMGAYQFMPGTVQMLANQGIKFDPFNEQQSRDAAKAYLTQLVSQNGGDMNKALAQYGGFKTKDPSSYINNVLGGANKVSMSPQTAPATNVPSGLYYPTPAEQAASLLPVETQKAASVKAAEMQQSGRVEIAKNAVAGYVKDADASAGILQTLDIAEKQIKRGTLGNSPWERAQMALHNQGIYQTPETINTANLMKLGNQLVLSRGSLGTGVSSADAERYDKAAGDFTAAQSNAERSKYIGIMREVAKTAYDRANRGVAEFNKTGNIPTFELKNNQASPLTELPDPIANAGRVINGSDGSRLRSNGKTWVKE